MFRLQESNLPKDPKFPADLKELGFFINEAGQFCMINYPDKFFQYYYSNNERVNNARREAYHQCQRREVAKRLSALGLVNLYLPQLTSVKPEDEASVPILAPPAEILRTRKRVIVIVNSTLQDLGILAYRELQRAAGVNDGSIIGFVKEIIRRSTGADDTADLFKDGAGVADKSKETPGIIVMNCGQLLYSYKFGEAKTVRSWNDMPVQSACHEPVQITEDNKIPGNRDATEHIKFVIENVLHNKDFVAEDAEIYMIGIENGGEHLVRVLDEHLERYGLWLTAMALIEPRMHSSHIHNPHLRAFLRRRARQWRVESSNNPAECVAVPSHYAEEVAALEGSTGEKVDVTPAEKDHLNWLDTVQASGTVSNILSAIPTQLANLKISLGPDHGTKAADDTRPLEDSICPTFCDDENPHGAGECIFIARSVQRCVLQFFEEVAKDPAKYHNPVFEVNAPDALEDNGWGEEETPADASTKAELKIRKEELERMKTALRNTPETAEFREGKVALEKRIQRLEKEYQELSEKKSTEENTGTTAAQEKKEVWEPVGRGPKVPFAGDMVDSELVKASGLDDSAEDDEDVAELAPEVNGQT
ncbi:uncharacterized protein EI97DRAFT_87539 [Westerdykella ornata]|uniref:Arb2 domain-containing protein n=1 Tax=Westerdykella ornata TaxID=318751 RepID=A0A6A6JJP4_WESOR|nr:uncharacterized protein EI97DRAFT_87539 [Westerdykella ornata]KAF2275089.1 hypothetical protein EI97DRAFT_87539 [Westerdykella ornata]